MSFSIDYLINTPSSTKQGSSDFNTEATTNKSSESRVEYSRVENTSTENIVAKTNQSAQKRERIKRSYAESPDLTHTKQTPDKRHRRDYAKGYRTNQRAKVGEFQQLQLRVVELRSRIQSNDKEIKYAKNLLAQQNSYIEGILRMNTNAVPQANSDLVRTQ